MLIYHMVVSGKKPICFMGLNNCLSICMVCAFLYPLVSLFPNLFSDFLSLFFYIYIFLYYLICVCDLLLIFPIDFAFLSLVLLGAMFCLKVRIYVNDYPALEEPIPQTADRAFLVLKYWNLMPVIAHIRGATSLRLTNMSTAYFLWTVWKSH